MLCQMMHVQITFHLIIMNLKLRFIPIIITIIIRHHLNVLISLISLISLIITLISPIFIIPL